MKNEAGTSIFLIWLQPYAQIWKYKEIAHTIIEWAIKVRLALGGTSWPPRQFWWKSLEFKGVNFDFCISYMFQEKKLVRAALSAVAAQTRFSPIY